MKKIIIIFILMYLLIPIINAEQLTFKQNQQINYRFRCFNETNNYCNSGTILLLSVEFPDGTNALDNSSMTYNETYFNHSLPTGMVGIYNSIIVSPTINGTVSEFTYEVSPTGYSGNLLGFYIIVLIIAWGLLVLGLWKRDMTFAILGTIGFYIIALYLLIMGINGTKDWLSNGMGIIHLGVAFYTSIRYTLESIDVSW